MIKGFLFDLDGTLVNTLEDIANAMNRSLRLHGLKEYPVRDYCYMVGNGARVLADRAVGDRKDLMEAVLADYQAYYETHNQVVSAPYPGIPELLEALKARNMVCMVLSNKPDADTQHVIWHYFGKEIFTV
nr:HAD hydrolase-like protein [Clostridiales bacterium]